MHNLLQTYICLSKSLIKLLLRITKHYFLNLRLTNNIKTTYVIVDICMYYFSGISNPCVSLPWKLLSLTVHPRGNYPCRLLGYTLFIQYFTALLTWSTKNTDFNITV